MNKSPSSKMKIILGSQSSGRQDVMRELGLDFIVVTAGIDEKAIRFSDPVTLTQALASAKADAILPKITQDSLLITADQVVLCNGEIREKPENPTQARQFLQSYAKFPAQTITAVAVTNTKTGQRVIGVDKATVWLRPMSESLISQFIDEGHVFHWAGGFGIQDAMKYDLVEKLVGTVDSIIGLPKALTVELLQALQ